MEELARYARLAMKQWWEEQDGYFGSFYLFQDSGRNSESSIRDRTEREVDGVVSLLNLRPPARVLDCPCGYGRHSLELFDRGCEVVGVDLNRTHLARARELYSGNGPAFREQNMLKLEYREEFDVVINMFASFGFFESEEEDVRLLENFYSALVTSGRLLVHVDVNIESILALDGPYKNAKTLSDGSTLRIVDTYDHKTSRLEGEWSIEREGRTSRTERYSVRIYTIDELVELCTSAGFRSVEAYGDWGGSPYKRSSSDMIVIATK